MTGVPQIAEVMAIGFAIGATLIIAIGAQNAFVLRQGLRREHVGAVVLFCAGADAALMAAGVWGLGRLLSGAPWLAPAMTLAGAAFLAAYGARALWRAAHPAALTATAGSVAPLRSTLIQCAAFTLLNPHVYLDTVILVGSVGNAQPAALRGWFVLGAASASAAWFSTLGYGARVLAPWFARPRAWQVLDSAVGLTMLGLAALLLNSLPR